MIYLTGVTSDTIERTVEGHPVGLFVQPRTLTYAERVERWEVWAGDNGAYTTDPAGFSPSLFRAMLADERLRHARRRCRFIAAPDRLVVQPDGRTVIGDAAGTLDQFGTWADEVHAAGFPVALVAQDGLETMLDRVPWSDVDALFLGASTGWKEGDAAARCVGEAARRGKLTHMGRVNSERRLRIADSFGCDTVDGTYLRFGPDVNLPKLLRWLGALDQGAQLRLAA